MSESKIPFKTNLDTPIRKTAAGASPEKGRIRRTKAGFWTRSREDSPLKASVVNKKQERIRLIKRIIIWALAIPLGGYILVWLYLIIADMFSF